MSPPRKATKAAESAPQRPPTGEELHHLITTHEAAYAAHKVALDAYYEARAALVAAMRAMGLERWPP